MTKTMDCSGKTFCKKEESKNNTSQFQQIYNYILALNCGSSSLKFNLFRIHDGILEASIQGIVEEIGNPAKSRLKYSLCSSNGANRIINHEIMSHKNALGMVFSEFMACGIDISSISAVGHRVVHGGVKYKSSVLIDDEVINQIRELFPIAPLHNPPNLTGIEEAIKLLPGVPQVAVFDTAFHASIPEYAFRYAVPQDWYLNHGVRRYGFHGTSHLYVSRRAARILGVPHTAFNCISVHLGNGCSITKVMGGRSVDTSMGFTPLEGLIMGTRSGDLDPAIISYVAERLALEKGIDGGDAFRKVMSALNRESGLCALGGTNMMQDIRKRAEEGDEASDIVVSIYAYRIAKYIGAYWATLSYVHAVIFTAGLGENEGYVRKRIMSMLANLKIEINEEENCKRKQEVIIGISRSMHYHSNKHNNCIDSSSFSSSSSSTSASTSASASASVSTGNNSGNFNESVSQEMSTKFMVIPTDEEIVLGYDAFYIGYLKQQAPDVYPFEL